MKEITKDNKAVTLVALIITVILMMILISVTTYTGINSYKNMQVTRFVTQMQLIQTKVDELSQSNTVIENFGEAITDAQKNIINLAYEELPSAGSQVDSEEYKSKFIFFSSESLKTHLDIADIEDDVLINFETREVVSINGIEYEGNIYYTQYNLPNGKYIINSTENSRELSFDLQLEFDGLNCLITVDNLSIANGTLSFSETDSDGNAINWQKITNYTEKGKAYSANITKAGNYIFKLEDNTDTPNNFTVARTIKLTNKPKTDYNVGQYNYSDNSSNWAYITSGTTTYVWIPRFAYDENNNIKFIKGNLNIATDDTYINSKWTVHSRFTVSGIELTGIWIEAARQDNLIMKDMLDDNNLQTQVEINL